MSLLHQAESSEAPDDERSDSLRLAAAVLLAGVLTGLVGSAFLLTLEHLDGARVALIAAAAAHGFPSWLAALISAALCVALAAWLAQCYAPQAPQASVLLSESVSRSDKPGTAFGLNFAGTGLAAFGGLALGPERPAMQMCGVIGRWVGRVLTLGCSDRELLVASSGGAGIAALFIAPLGCAAYTMEVVLKRVDMRISLTTLGTGAVAVAVVSLLLGREGNYTVGALPDIAVGHLAGYLLLGALIAGLGNLHNRMLLTMIRAFQRIGLSALHRGALIGGCIGLLAWYTPALVGPGDSLTQQVIDGHFPLWLLAVMLLVRFFLGPLSIAAGTPGGYFTPVLVLGALTGAIAGHLLAALLPSAEISTTALTLVGMGAALASVARAPFTGILLTMETTLAFPVLLPMTVAVVGAAIVTRLLRTPSLGHGLEALHVSRQI